MFTPENAILNQDLPQDLESILERVQEIAKDVVAPEADNIDRDAIWPDTGIRALQQAGLGGLTVPEEFGGLGQGSVGVAQACEILGVSRPRLRRMIRQYELEPPPGVAADEDDHE